MVNAFNDAVLQGMGERTVSDIMKENGGDRSIALGIRYLVTLSGNHFQRAVHQVGSTECMLEPGMVGCRINIKGEPELPDPP